MYKEWLHKNPTPESKKLKFRYQWIKTWEKENGISLRKPNQRYSIEIVDLVERHEDCFKNILSNRHYFLEKYGMDPPIINGNEITLHRNKRSRQKNLNFKSEKKNCERESYAVT